MKIRKLFLSLLAVLLTTALLSGCGAQSLEGAKSEAAYDAAGDYTYAAAENADGVLASSAESGTASAPVDQKLIRTVYLEAETEDMPALLTDTQNRVNALGGYVENRNVYNGTSGSRRSRSAALTIRIPADRLDSFVEQVSEGANIISHNESTKDVTLSYVATESRITALQTEETRLLELLAAAQDLKDLLTLEEKLTDVRTELEQHRSQLKLYDNQVNYATVHLTVTEVVEYTVVEEPEPEPGYWEKLGTGFVNSVKTVWKILKALSIFFVSAIPYLILPAIVLVILFVPRLRKNRKQKKQKQEQQKQDGL